MHRRLSLYQPLIRHHTPTTQTRTDTDTDARNYKNNSAHADTAVHVRMYVSAVRAPRARWDGQAPSSRRDQRVVPRERARRDEPDHGGGGSR